MFPRLGGREGLDSLMEVYSTYLTSSLDKTRFIYLLLRSFIYFHLLDRICNVASVRF